MIYDKIELAGRYRGISKYLDIAIAFILEQDLSKLPMGKTLIDEENVFVNVMTAETVPEHSLNFEIHKKYMDIQIDLEGVEIIQIGLGNSEPLEEYKEEIDFQFRKCEMAASCIMGPGRFIICMKEEPHKPGIMLSEQKIIKKCVIKVRADVERIKE